MPTNRPDPNHQMVREIVRGVVLVVAILMAAFVLVVAIATGANTTLASPAGTVEVSSQR